jgi:antirestriction protein ArdC
MKPDIYQTVTDRVISLIETGTVPWQSRHFAHVGWPKNFISMKPYQGINVFLLGSLLFTTPWFLTYLQAKALGGHVRKGERGFLVVKYGTYTKTTDSPESGSPEFEERRFLKGYTVFHASQIEGVSFPPPDGLSEFMPDPGCSRAAGIVANMPNSPTIKEGVARAFYQPATDSVHMPERGFFVSQEAYYSTLFHELIHSTGHQTRLARKSLIENKGFGFHGDEERKVYAEEELVAEMGATFLNVHAGIGETQVQNSAAYLQGWLKALKSGDAKSWIIRASSQAQKAANYILGFQPTSE